MGAVLNEHQHGFRQPPQEPIIAEGVEGVAEVENGRVGQSVNAETEGDTLKRMREDVGPSDMFEGESVPSKRSKRSMSMDDDPETMSPKKGEEKVETKEADSTETEQVMNTGILIYLSYNDFNSQTL